MLVCLWTTGCPGTEPDTRPCKPLGERERQIELADVLGIGRAKDGRIVVVDRSSEASPEERLFVSDGDTLVRRGVAGSGSSSAGEVEVLTLLSTDGPEPLRVLLENSAGRVRMKLLEGQAAAGDRTLEFASAAGEELEILARADLASLHVRDLPGTVRVEYFARAGKDRLVVTRPEHDFEYEDFRLFFGRPRALAEREILELSRARDGGSTRIDFALDGDTASVFFPNRLQPDGPPITEPVTFEVAGSARDIARAPADAAELRDLEFQCL
ncbi:MAG TPA: hypothetical protein VJR89_23730 [Polyangiales bacterium]|nr:hypothetical protein [Polyangiales bacterium]